MEQISLVNKSASFDYEMETGNSFSSSSDADIHEFPVSIL